MGTAEYLKQRRERERQMRAEIRHLREQNAMLLEELESATHAAEVDGSRAKRLYQQMGEGDRFELNRWRAAALRYAAQLARLGYKPTLPSASDGPGDAPTLS